MLNWDINIKTSYNTDPETENEYKYVLSIYKFRITIDDTTIYLTNQKNIDEQ